MISLTFAVLGSLLSTPSETARVPESALRKPAARAKGEKTVTFAARDDAFGPDGSTLDSKSKPMWSQYMSTTCGNPTGPHSDFFDTRFENCPEDKPFLHFIGSRYCCKPSARSNLKQCCDLLATVSYGVQQAKMHENVIREMSSAHYSQYMKSVVPSADYLALYASGAWASLCPAETFEQAEPIDDVPDRSKDPEKTSREPFIAKLLRWMAWCY
jgi:hypothetical protein